MRDPVHHRDLRSHLWERVWHKYANKEGLGSSSEHKWNTQLLSHVVLANDGDIGVELAKLLDLLLTDIHHSWASTT